MKLSREEVLRIARLARLGLTEDEAFRRLQRQSQDTNRRLAEVAQAIVMADQMM